MADRLNDSESIRRSALTRLDALLGAWTERVDVPGVPTGRTSFESTLDRQFLIQRSEIPDPDFPDRLAVIAPNSTGAGYTQH